MSMEINSSGRNYNSAYSGYFNKAQIPPDNGKEPLPKHSGEEAGGKTAIPQDEYIPSEESENNPSGLYHIGQDENGKPKVIYAGRTETEKAKTEPAPKAETCTINTDDADKEIETLKEKKKQLEQQIAAAADDPEKAAGLKNQLAQIERELSQKDNDAYRKQNAVVS